MTRKTATQPPGALTPASSGMHTGDPAHWPPARRGLSTGVFAIEHDGAQAELTPEDLAQSVRWLAEPSVAAACFLPTLASATRSAVVSATQIEVSLSGPLLQWLSAVRETTLFDVPINLRRPLMCFRALVVPIASPVLVMGWVVLPAPDNHPRAVRELDGIITDFALRLELRQRDEVLRSLSGRLDRNADRETLVCSVPEAGSIAPGSRRSA